MSKQGGFSAFEGILIVLFVLAVGFAGWYVWDRNRSDDEVSMQNISSYDECVAAGYPIIESFPERCAVPGGQTFTRKLAVDEDEETEKTEKTVSQPSLTALDREAQSWISVTSGNRGLTVRVPDGWVLNNSESDNFLYSSSIEYSAGKAAGINDVPMYAGDSQFRITISQGDVNDFGESYPPRSGDNFVDLDGRTWKKNRTQHSIEPCGGIGCLPGSEEIFYTLIEEQTITYVRYIIFDHNQYSEETFGIKVSDKNQEEIVDTMVRTLQIN